MNHASPTTYLAHLGWCTILFIMTWLHPTPLMAAGYLEHPKFVQLIEEMQSVNTQDGEQPFTPETLRKVFSNVERQQNIIDLMTRPAEKTKTWAEYRGIFISQKQVDNGIAFWRQHKKSFERAEQQFDVPAEIILAIIGVETRYGEYRGKHSVLSSLATLAFDYPPRSDFFYKQLKAYLVLSQALERDPSEIKGSYAGAMGFPQFIPTSYQHYAIDFDNDGLVDLIDNPTDAIGSVANYFAEHKWIPNAPVMIRAKLAHGRRDSDLESQSNRTLKPNIRLEQTAQLGLTPDTDMKDDQKVVLLAYQAKAGTEYWLGLHNFYVITRYNRSRLYARTVYELSQLLREAMDS